MRPSRPRFARRLGTRGLFLTPPLVIPAKAGTHISAIRSFLSNRSTYLRMGSCSGTRGAGFSPGKRITVVGSVDADRSAEGLADRSVEDEVGDWAEAGWLAIYDYQCCAVVFRQFREGGGGINHQ